jgi:hypothetical protein
MYMASILAQIPIHGKIIKKNSLVTINTQMPHKLAQLTMHLFHLSYSHRISIIQ